MPIYEYKCNDCGHRFDALQKISDAPLNTCTECGGPVEKLVSATAFQFKGSGWYVTDYRNKKDEEKTRVESAPAEKSPAEEKTEKKEDKKSVA